jgi:hypothetical protein
VPGTVLAKTNQTAAAHNIMLTHIRTQQCPDHEEREMKRSIKPASSTGGPGAKSSKGSWERCPAGCACPATGVNYCKCAVSSAGAITSFFCKEQVS